MLDFDDTHMGGVVLHTSSPILAALFALAERASVNGRAISAAYAAGFEAGVRAGSRRPAITTAAGISPARSAPSRPAPRAASCSASTRSR